MIIGEPGVGKSMLLNALSSYARETDATVLSGRAVEGAGTFRPLAEALMPPLRAGTLPEGAELRPYRAALGRLLPDWARHRPRRPASTPSWCWAKGSCGYLRR